MSGLLAGKVWHSALEADLKPLAATLADIGDDDGSNIYPSVAFIAWRLGRVESCVRDGLRKLREAGILIVVREGGGRSNPTEYQMDIEALPKRPKWSAKSSDENPPFNPLNPPVNGGYSGKKPSGLDPLNPPVNTPKPSGLGGETLRPTGGDPSLPVLTRHLTRPGEDEENPTPSEGREEKPSPEEKSTSPEEIYREAKGIYRRFCRGNLGKLSGRFLETWAAQCAQYGREALLGALEIWARELDRPREIGFPLAVFLKNLDEYLEAYEIEKQPLPSREEAEGGGDGGMLTIKDIMRERKERELELEKRRRG